MASGEEAPVCSTVNEMETLLMQELSSFCTDTALAAVLWLQTQLPTEAMKGVDSQAAASHSQESTL